MQFDLNPRIVPRKLDNRNAVGFGKTVVEFDPVLQFLEFRRSVLQFAADFRLINARHFRSGVRQTIRQIAVVREQKQPLGIPIQTPDGENARQPLGQQIDNRRAMLRVVERRNAFGRLVEQYVIALFRIKYGLVVDLNPALARHDNRPRLGHDAPAHFYPPLGDHLLGMAAAGHTGQTQKLLNSHCPFGRL